MRCAVLFGTKIPGIDTGRCSNSAPTTAAIGTFGSSQLMRGWSAKLIFEWFGKGSGDSANMPTAHASKKKHVGRKSVICRTLVFQASDGSESVHAPDRSRLQIGFI